MKRLQANIVIDIAMLFAITALSMSGWVIKIIMPSKGIHHRGAFATHHEILQMECCTWREIHMWAGIILLILLIIHIVMHWAVISAFFQKSIPNHIMRISFYTLLLVISLSAAAPWIYFMIF